MNDLKGLYNKYTVTKTDGTPIDPDAQYFVLRIDKDPAARIAVAGYAMLIAARNPQLGTDLLNMIGQYITSDWSDHDTETEW